MAAERTRICALLWALGCAARPAAPGKAPTPSAVALPAEQTRATPVVQPLAVPSATPAPEQDRTLALPVPDFEPALVELPSSPEPAPVLVVAHGAGGSAEAHCALWQRISAGRAILLCLRGRAIGPSEANGSYYPDHHALERESFAALESLGSRLAGRIAPGPALYAGFSQGATMGSLMLVEHAQQVSRLALVEGGSNDWNLARARAFKQGGGERVLFVCGRKECAETARVAAHWLSLSGVATRVEYVRGAGHSHGEPIEARLQQAFPWLIEGDPRWN